MPHLLNILNMNIDQLQELKQKLTNDADLSDIWLFYMDHFADHPEFTDIGGPADNKYLDAVLQKTEDGQKCNFR